VEHRFEARLIVERLTTIELPRRQEEIVAI
jgi:hypothetical protein